MAQANLDPSKCSTAGYVAPTGVEAPAAFPAAPVARAPAAAAANVDDADAMSNAPTNLVLQPATIAAIAAVIVPTSATRATAVRRISAAGKLTRPACKPKRRPRCGQPSTSIQPSDGGDERAVRGLARPAITADEKAMLLAMISHLRGLNSQAERAAAVRGFTKRQVQLFSWYQKQCRRLRRGVVNDKNNDAVRRSAELRPAVAAEGARQAAARRAAIARQLQLLIHASHCQDSSCKVEHCSTMKAVLRHMADCTAGWACVHPHCASSRALIQHFSQCQVAHCPICPGTRDRDQVGDNGSGGDSEFRLP